ncbi:OFA family MFS transporter [Cutibacterium sp. WCA-380-WT-3A]|uniref:OFA family MFS transporter n=1 Tax=Cutibacterium porci TaxID=2605781 RepID=A0A7K0J6H0_9ACTN|nr:MFS transporter [Cutibacterium porci]MSS45566.1 OFA family MFS transporter [Cutibacterium porci]
MFTLPPLFTAWWEAATGASDASLGWVTTCAVLASGLLTYVAGIVRQQLGTRWMYIAATVLMLISLAVVLVNPRSLPTAYVWALLSGASSAFAYSPSLAAVQEWFPRRLGLVTGLVSASFALPAAAAAPAVGAMLRHWGFTVTIVALIVTISVTQVVAIILSTPHWLEKERAAGLTASRTEIAALSVTTTQAVRTPAFWQVWAIWFAGGGAAVAMMTLVATYSAHLNDVGVPVSAVAAITAFVSGNGLVRVFDAIVLDRIGPTVIGGIASLTLALGYALLGFVTSVWVLISVAFLAGATLGTIFTISPMLLTPLFGIKHFGPIFGLAFTAYGVFGAFAGPMLSSYLAQWLGYGPVFIYLAVLMVWAFISVLAVGRSQRRIATLSLSGK